MRPPYPSRSLASREGQELSWLLLERRAMKITFLGKAEGYRVRDRLFKVRPGTSDPISGSRAMSLSAQRLAREKT